MIKERNNYASNRAGVGVGVLVYKSSKILLIKRTGSHGEGMWSTPGGHIDFGESIEETAIRETREEIGVDVATPKFIAITNDVFPDDGKHYITIWMKSAYAGQKPRVVSTRELTDVGWFSPRQLPQPLFVAFQNLIDGKYYPEEATVWQQK